MTMKSSFRAVMIFASCCRLFGQAQTDPNNWEKLNLSSTSIAGATVHYDKSFEPNLPFFEKEYKKFLAEKEKGKVISYKKDQIIADINHILGISEPDSEMQNRLWTWFTGVFSIEKTIFYVVKQGTIKDFLRAGGQLPNFTYDKSNDIAAYKPEFKTTSKDGPIKDFEFTFPIASEKTFEKNVSLIFRVLQDGFKGSLYTAIHETVEMSLLMHIRPTDPYWRWFSDGVANCVTYELLKKYAGTEIADDFIKGYDVNEYNELKKELNLRYWMSGRFCILLQDMPTEAGKRFNYARYVFATHEVRRLIDRHGIDCVHRILDEISVKQSRTSSELLETIKNVTSEDINVRLDAYQSFVQRQEGVEKYAKAFNEASQKKDFEQMLVNLFRLHELRLPSEAEQLLYDYRYSATLLFNMGFEQEADKTMENCIGFFSNPGFTNGRVAASEAFILYALECEKPLKARMVAEELLKTASDNVSALTIQMFVHLADKQLSEAKELARKIISLSKNKESRNYKAASFVLKIDPNKTDIEK